METPRHIALFIDGTWNRHRRSRNTNVRQLFEATPILAEQSRRQVTCYLRGVGTKPWWFQLQQPVSPGKYIEAELPSVLRPFRPLLGGAFGLGTAARIKEAYAFICSHFVKSRGDRIFLFGFSRGAFAARSLAGFIDRVGLLLQDKLEHVEAAYALYESGVDPAQSALATYLYDIAGKGFPTAEDEAFLPVHFLGVWDTVGALGLPSRMAWLTAPFTEYHQTEVPPNVMHARHALALHELRRHFEPMVWSNRTGHPSLRQIWFAGAHADVGGGYQSGETAFSDLALNWMAAEAERQGLVVDRSKAWWNATPQPLEQVHHEIRGVFSASAPCVRRHVVGENIEPCLDTFSFHRSVLWRLNEPSARIYRFWQADVRDALRSVDEHTLKRFLQTRLLGNALAGKAMSVAPQQLPAAPANRMPWWSSVSLGELETSAQAIRQFLREGPEPTADAVTAFARALALQLLCVDESTLPDVLAMADANVHAYRAWTLPATEQPRPDPRGWLRRSPGVRNAFEQLLALLPASERESARPQVEAYAMRSKKLEQAYVHSLFTEGVPGGFGAVEKASFPKSPKRKR